MNGGLAAEVAAITADFDAWHAYLSYADDGQPARVCAARALPTRPCEPGCTDPRHRDLRGSYPAAGLTLDTRTPGQMRDLLSARCGS